MPKPSFFKKKITVGATLFGKISYFQFNLSIKMDYYTRFLEHIDCQEAVTISLALPTKY
jgi:hypothetical protein